MNARTNRSVKLLICLVVLLTLAALTVLWIVHSAQAKREGELQLEGLQGPVAVFYDAWGVPHIDATNEEDAYRALGYVHAQDRLFQMDLLRRIGGGRLAELFGADSFETDRFFRSLGITWQRPG